MIEINFEEEIKILKSKLESGKKYKEEILPKLKKDNAMKNNLSWKECKNRFENVVTIFDSHTHEAWNYFKSIYRDIPQEHRLKIQLLSIYTYYQYNFYEFYEYLKKSLDEETEDQYKSRIKNNKKILKDYLIKWKGKDRRIHYSIKLYRGRNENSLEEDFALSYTVNKDVAEWFVNRFNI